MALDKNHYTLEELKELFRCKLVKRSDSNYSVTKAYHFKFPKEFPQWYEQGLSIEEMWTKLFKEEILLS